MIIYNLHYLKRNKLLSSALQDGIKCKSSLEYKLIVFLVKYSYIICSIKSQIRVSFVLLRCKTKNPRGLSVLQFAE
jgi:hypothetical protein